MGEIKYPEIDVSPVAVAVEGPSAPPLPAVPADDVIHVALGKEVKESELTLGWALRISGGRRICIIHVHQPAKRIPFMGTKFSIDKLSDVQVRTFHEAERQEMQKILKKYVLICEQAKVHAEKVYIEMDSIEKGILELISQHGIRKLVMGGAANKSYSKKMLEPKSKKAMYVRLHAPVLCHIWFICKGHLIHTRQSKLDVVNTEVTSPSLVASPSTITGWSGFSRSISAPERQIDQSEYLDLNNYRARSINNGMKKSTLCATGGVTPFDEDGSTDGWDGIARRSPSAGSQFSSGSSSEVNGDSHKDHHHLSHPPSSIEANIDDDLYDRLQQLVTDAEKSRQEAYEESKKRRKAEKEAIDAICRAKASEAIYAEELRMKREIEEALTLGKEEIDKMKEQLDELVEYLRIAQEKESSLEYQVANSDGMVQELEQKILSAVDLLQKYKKERDELQVELDNALREVEVLREKQAREPSYRSIPRFFSEFSFLEIKEATHNFDPILKIGEGGYGSIYRGLLRQTEVAIKMLHPNSLQGPLEFQQEVNILSKLRHPNLVTLIGACPEAWTLVYEYLPNGSLDDRLNCKDNTPPLSWQTRIHIVAELCSVLIFLHSCRPQGIVHGDLKPANILLDTNYVSKLSDFGICCILTQDEFSINNTLLSCNTDPKGTFAYMDPEFLATGEVTPKSDVYSFGIILLRLLTGRPALGITKEVQYALDKGKLKDLLDPAAGDWPFVQAKQLAHLAMSCCEMNGRNRPDLSSDVWRVLEPMRVSCGVSSSRLGSEERYQIPSYFICPIFQEIMQDPVVAADGFTYEAEALKGWLDGGHDTSPMTNLKLAHHNLVPNHALRSSIQEWLQTP